MSANLEGQVCTLPVRLRPYQMDAITRVEERIRAGVRRIVIVAATGSGKSTIAGQIIVDAFGRGQRTLFLAHRRELIFQAYRRFIDMGIPEHQIGILMADDARRRPTAMVQVASVDTLRHRAKPSADILFRDECHRASCRTDREIASHYPNAIHLGLTATPYRADNKGLEDAYDELVIVSSPKQLIAQGCLVEPRVFTVPRSALPDLSQVRIRGGDYDESALANAVDKQTLVGNIVEHWHKHASGIRTVVFAVSVAHSKHIADRFRDAGVSAEHLDGTTPTQERDAILARLEAGETLVVANCSVLCEGWDQPAVKCAILARPTKSTGLYLQQAGRILRPWHQQQAIILDHGGCVLEHGFPQDDREFSLETQKKKRTKSEDVEVPLKVCEQCYAVLPVATRICPECGFMFMVSSDVPQETDNNLVELTQSPLDEMRAEWLRLRAVAATRGYKPGWAYYQFRDRFGRPPPKGLVGPSSMTLERKRAVFDQMLRKETNRGWASTLYRMEFGENPPQDNMGLGDVP